MSDTAQVAPSWPAVEYESIDWVPRSSTLASYSVRLRHRGPYEAALVPKIADLEVPLSAEEAALAEEASSEIARFDAELGSEIAPFSAVLLRSESAASSKIENLTASARAIAEAELAPQRSGNAAMVVANTKAMTAAIALAGQINAAAIITMHDSLIDPGGVETPGQFHDDQVWIGGSDFGPHEAMFIPPHHRWVQGAVDDLVAFIARSDVPVLAHAAIAHAQFETIHPFFDGNGRTGRALMHAQLRNKGLTRNVTVPVSAGLLVNTDSYFAALIEFRNGDVSSIIRSVAEASFAAVGNGRQLVGELHEIRSEWEGRLNVRRGGNSWRLADLLLRHPVVNRQLIAAELQIRPENIYRLVAPLLEAGIVVEFTGRQRNQMWRSVQVLEALDRFAVRAGRRSRSSR